MGKPKPIVLPEKLDPHTEKLITRAHIVVTYRRTGCIAKTSRDAGVTIKMARYWLARVASGVQTPLLDAPRSGRPPKLDKETAKKLIKLVENEDNDIDTAAQLQYAAGLEHTVSVRTIRRTLTKFSHYPGVTKQRVLTDRHKLLRLQFARKFRTGGAWSRTLFTDSTYVYVGMRKRRWVLLTKKNYGLHVRKALKIHVYAGITAAGRTRLIFCTGTSQQKPFKKGRKGVGGEEYRERVLPVFVDYGRAMMAGETWRFVQDGAKPHTAKATQTYLQRELGDHWVRDWPPNSADLNPIENVWALLKSELRGKKFPTIGEFKVAANAAWHRIPQRHLTRCVGSIWRRLRACVRAGGGYIPY